MFHRLAASLLLATLTLAPVHAQDVLASFYGSESGRVTASGTRFRPLGLTAAHRSLPFGTRLRVTFRGRVAVCTVNDRGPALWTGRGVDLSRGCARAVGLEAVGVGHVSITRLN